MDMSHRWRFYPIIHTIMVAIHLGLSIVFIATPRERFSSASWQPLKDFTNGSLVPWGIAIGVAGVLMASGRLWTDIIGEAVAICWFSFLASLFLVALSDPKANASGFVIFSGLMAINAALVAQRVIDWTKWRNTNRRVRA
jgi:hypothetical protein